MGRAGAGGAGGGRSSGGGHSVGRTGGGHSVGGPGLGGGSSSGGRRAGSGSLGGGLGGGQRGGAGMPGGFGTPGGADRPGGGFRVPSPKPTPPPTPGRNIPPTPPPPPGGGRGRGGGCGPLFGTMLMMVLALVLSISAMSCSRKTPEKSGAWGSAAQTGAAQTSTVVRTKLESGNAYNTDCIIDELGWFDNVSKTESKLKDFWTKTGVQPYIILKAYDESLTTNSEKEQWSQDYYDEHFDAEDIFLYVYFAEKDSENDVGYMTYTNGYQTSSVMDSEAVEIFWNNIDKYWYTDLSTDDVFINVYNDTAETIMHVSTTGKDILKWILIVIAIILVGGIVIHLVHQKNKRAKEKAEEDRKILETPISDLAKDDLENKYL